MMYSNYSNYNLEVISEYLPVYSADELNIIEPELIDFYETLGSPINNNGDFI